MQKGQQSTLQIHVVLKVMVILSAATGEFAGVFAISLFCRTSLVHCVDVIMPTATH
jgi:hypothetical protein